MKQRRNVIAAALCIVVVLAMFVSSAYIVHEMSNPHNCTGEDCPICQFIAQLEQTRRGFGLVLLALLLLACFLTVFHFPTHPEGDRLPIFSTLVIRKIQLND